MLYFVRALRSITLVLILLILEVPGLTQAGCTGTPTAWTLTFYADNSGMPGNPITTGVFHGTANQSCTVLGVVGGFVTCTYSLNFDSYNFGPGTYWVSVVPDLGFKPEWSWSRANATPGNLDAYHCFYGNCSPANGGGVNLAFQLFGANLVGTVFPPAQPFDYTGVAYSSQNDTNSQGNFATAYDSFTVITGNVVYVDSIAWTGEYSNCTCALPANTTMVAWYPFEEAASPSADIAAGNTATWFGSPVQTIGGGKVGNSLTFNGTSSYVEAPSSIATNFGPAGTPADCVSNGNTSACAGNFSIDAWVRIPTNAPTDIRVILDKRAGSPPNMQGYHFFVSGGSLGIQLADGLLPAPGYSNYYSPVLAPTIYDGNWHHVAVTVNRQQVLNGIKWYYDGAFVGSCDPTGGSCPNPTPPRFGPLWSPLNNGPLRIGTRTADPPLTGYFDGDIDELEIYNRELQDPEIERIFMAGSNGKCKCH